MAVNKVTYHGTTLIDTTGNTATAADIAKGKTAKEVLAGYKKVNGAWVQQDITTLFSSSNNYKKG